MEKLVDGPRTGRLLWLKAAAAADEEDVRVSREMGGGAVKITFSVLAVMGGIIVRNERRRERERER